MMSSSFPASVAVEKATSDLLMIPDWTMNINICDLINSHHWQAKDVIKVLKKRLQHKNPKVQLLALTLIETLVKNCGDHVHLHIGDKNVLGEMLKIVKKKADMQVRSRVLILLNSWQEAFGSQNGKRTQYFWACEDLKRFGVQFPQLPPDAAPMFTKTAANPTPKHAHEGVGLPSNSSKMLDETIATEVETVSLSVLNSMRNIMELLSDMLQAVSPSDRGAVKDEVITDIVNCCRSNQKKLMQMLMTTRDEGLLARGFELNDGLQIILARHDAIESGSALPICRSSSFILDEASASKSSEASSSRKAEASIFSKHTDMEKSSPIQNDSSKASVVSPRKVQKVQITEDEEVEDDFVQLAKRHSRTPSISGTQSLSVRSSEVANGTETSYALALTNPPEPVKSKSKEQDMIDLLSLALVPASSPTQTQPSSSEQDMHQAHTSSIHGNPYGSENYPGNQVHVPFDSYVVPWAQPQTLSQQQTQAQVQVRYQSASQLQYQFQDKLQCQPHFQPSFQLQLQQQFPTNCHPQPQLQVPSQIHLQTNMKPQLQYQALSQSQHYTSLQAQLRPQANQHYSSGYPPPPWAPTPGYYSGQSHICAGNGMVSTTENGHHSSSLAAQAARPLPHLSSYSSTGTNGCLIMGDSQVNNSGPGPTAAQQKPYIPSYRLFEDLNVLGNTDGKLKMASSTSPSLSGASGQGIVGTHRGLGKF